MACLAGAAPGAPAFHEFGQAGAYITLPDHDPARPSMSARLITNWGTAAGELYAPFPVGELRMHHDLPDKPYLGPGQAAPGSIDILELCNRGGTGVSCVDNRRGVNLTASSSSAYGHVLNLPAAGRSIVHIANVSGTLGNHLEVFFTCPECRAPVKAYWGVEDPLWSSYPFQARGFAHPTTTMFNGDAPPLQSNFGPGALWRLAWGGVTDSRGITFWEDGGACTPNLAISNVGPYQIIDNMCNPSNVINAGTAQAQKWKALTPGWNSVTQNADSFIIVADPGAGARLQVRNGTDGCCAGFDGGLVNMAGRAAVIHNEDRHLLVAQSGA